MSKQKIINTIDMISWLREKFRDEYNVHDRYDKELGLPIHLYCTKTTIDKKGKEATKECLVIVVASASTIKREYFNKLCFFQSYLSLYMGSDELKLILAIPSNAKIINEELYGARGFGLLKIKALTDKEPAEFEDEWIYEPNTLRNRMVEEFGKKFNGKDKEDTAIARFFSQYVEEAVFGIAGANPVKFEERNIDRKLLELIANLDRVSYAAKLRQIANEYLSYEKDDYTFAMWWVRDLWNRFFSTPYPDIHEKMEPMLKELYPKYRDHFLHQFQVFLLGSIMIDCLIRPEKLNVDKDTLSKGWLLTATFHDFAQAVQKYDDWNKTFFEESLEIKKAESLELKRDYVENTFSSSVEHIISSLEKCFCDFDGEDHTDNRNKIRHFFYHQITDRKNHGLLSSLSLLKRFKGNDEFHTTILPSATAIAIHDDDIWQPLNGVPKEYDGNERIIELCRDFCTLKPLPKLKLDIQPLSFLLILCDNIQDWGRHFRDSKLEESSSAANPGLKSISSNGNKITIQLFVDFNTNSLDYLKYKVDTLKLVKALLQAPSPHFLIELWDREKNEKLDMDVEIGE